MRLLFCASLVATLTASAQAGWVVLPSTDNKTSLPKTVPADARPIKPGDKWTDESRFRWIIGDLQIPEQIDGKPVQGQPVGLKVNCGDGGEAWVDGKIQTRFDNDHPGLVLVSANAQPGASVQVAIESYGKVQGGADFSEASWTLLDPARATGTLTLTIDSAHPTGKVPNGIIGLSQGGGMSDYEPATAKKLVEGGFKWFRMDNILTGVVKRENGKLVYDWKDLDKRVDFIHSIGAQIIFAASYEPQVFDAVPDGERHSAPANYKDWEELCYQAAHRCAQRGKPVAFWEVWNETNAGWLKPGPQDTGAPLYAQLYREALGKEPTDHEVVRRFEAYCKLYKATALGVRRGDPHAKVGGPVLASGPFESSEGGNYMNGRGFARGLILFCAHEHLPLDFLSWHEYFQPADVMVKEVQEMHNDVKAFPQFKSAGQNLILSEWNEAWWTDRPHDHELGAAWCANCVTRCFIPYHLERPCLFYVKQGDNNFRGDFSILMGGNVPKATYNMAKVFNSLHGQWLPVKGTDGEVSAVAAWDKPRRQLVVVLVNFNSAYDLGRKVQIATDTLPNQVRGGSWQRWTIDATHSNVWNDSAHAELEQTGSGTLSAAGLDEFLPSNSITVLEFTPRQ